LTNKLINYSTNKLHLLTLSWIYLIFLLVLGLWPFNFRQVNIAATDQTSGLMLAEPGTAYTTAPPTKISGMNNFTIYMNVSPDTYGSNGYPRIVTYSLDDECMNFMVGQWNDSLVFKLKADKRERPIHFETDGIFSVGRQTSLAVVFDSTRLSLYKDGEVKKARNIGPLTFRDWDPSYPLVVGSEADGKTCWQGTIHSIALYDRALSVDEVKELSAGAAAFDPLVYYDFMGKSQTVAGSGLRVNGSGDKGEGKRDKSQTVAGSGLRVDGSGNYKHATRNSELGTVVHDLGRGQPADLVIPRHFTPYKRTFLAQPSRYWKEYKRNAWDMVINIAGFVPLGFLLIALSARCGLRVGASVTFALFAGCLLSLTIEALQAYLPSRDSSMMDLITNTVGTGVGAVVGARGKNSIQ
jgi:hypothetical protein